MNHTHPIYVLIVLMFYILLHYWYKPSRFYYSSNRRLKNIIGGIIIILLCVFSVQDSDYFHYKEYISLLKSGHDISSLERVYIWIAEFVSYNYFLFRLLIWGGAYILFTQAAKRMHCDEGLVAFFFVSMYLSKFSYSRASLAMAIGIYGFSLIISSYKTRLIPSVCGVVLIFMTYFFHKSAVIFVPIYILSLFRWGKKGYFILLLFLFALYLYFSKYGVDILFSMEDNTIFDYKTAMSYLNKDKSNIGVAALIQRVLERIPYYLILLIILRNVFWGKNDVEDYSMRCLMNFSFIVIVFSSLFLFDFGGNTSVIYYRLLYYSILPLSILLSKLYTTGIDVKVVRTTQRIGYISVLYAILYSAYNMYVLSF